MNWYVLYILSQKSNKIITNLNRKKELIAFIPEYEICHRKTKEITIKPMFSNYIFVKTDLNQSGFNDLLLKMKDENDGLIKQLKNCETSALRESEIEFFQMILDEQYIVRLSYSYQENGITHVTKGPLKPFEKHIVKVDKHNQCAYLDLLFFDRRIMLGIDIKCKN